MKRKLLITMMAVVLAFSCTACGDKKEDTQGTEAKAEISVKEEFVQFVGTDIPKADAKEAEIMNKFNSYFAEGSTIDADALLKDLSENIIPQYKAFLDEVQAIEVTTDDIKALKDKYITAMTNQYDALTKMETAMKDKNKDVQAEAEKLLEDAHTNYAAYCDAVSDIAKRENITLKGEMATTAATEATTEVNTQEIDVNQVMTDEVVTTESAQ